MLDPLKILEEEWRNIQTGIKTSKHDYHSFVLSTTRNNNPDSRTVILRAFDLEDPSIWGVIGKLVSQLDVMPENMNAHLQKLTK